MENDLEYYFEEFGIGYDDVMNMPISRRHRIAESHSRKLESLIQKRGRGKRGSK